MLSRYLTVDPYEDQTSEWARVLMLWLLLTVSVAALALLAGVKLSILLTPQKPANTIVVEAPETPAEKPRATTKPSPRKNPTEPVVVRVSSPARSVLPSAKASPTAKPSPPPPSPSPSPSSPSPSPDPTNPVDQSPSPATGEEGSPSASADPSQSTSGSPNTDASDESSPSPSKSQ